MRDYFLEHIPMNIPSLSEYPDFFALTITLLFSVALAFGAKESSLINNLFTLTNMAVVLYVIICGSFKSNVANWQIPAEAVPDGYGDGGFAPYGLTGIIKGAAICFYGFIGFDCIATAGEEAKDPKKSIPISIIVSLGIIFMAYFGISTVLTMMLPYFDQDQDAPLPYVFRYFGWTVAEYIVAFGAIFGLCASLMGAMFPLPRIVYAMSSDGLLFTNLSKIHPRFQTPFVGTLLAGVLTGCLAAVFNLSQLVNMMSIGTLMAYSVVAACVLMLRYEVTDENEKLRLPMPISRHWKGYLWNIDNTPRPTKLTSIIVTWEIALYCKYILKFSHPKRKHFAPFLTNQCPNRFTVSGLICLLFSLFVSSLSDMLFEGNWIAYALVVLCLLPIVGMLALIKRQPTSDVQLTFTVPLVPWLPGLSILINIYLMTQLDVMTWIRFLVWLVIGFSIYFTYGIKNSVEKTRIEQVRFERSIKEHDSSEVFTSSRDILVPTGQ